VHGGNGNDVISAGDTSDMLFGDAGDDKLMGEHGTDWLVGGTGNDTLTGGTGFADSFVFQGGAASALGTDNITDFEANGTMDVLVFDSSDLGLDGTESVFVGSSAAASGAYDVIVITDTGYVSVDAAATAIANAGTGTTHNDDGIFVFLNLSTGYAQVVHSTNLGGNGTETVLANLTSVTSLDGTVGVDLSEFTAANFDFIA
jgi:Ca2+-binding RTX toxin-like protein